MASGLMQCRATFLGPQVGRPQPASRARSVPCAAAGTDSVLGLERNANLGKLAAGYLFPEIARRRREHLEAHPNAPVISLGIGDTTRPIPKSIADAMAAAAAGLATPENYSGYGAEQGDSALRAAIANNWYNGVVDADEVFVSDGAKCDIARLQLLFGPGLTVAVQDPSYPAYVDTSVMMGRTKEFDAGRSQYMGITYLPCTIENGFFPDLSAAADADVIFFCSPNNPTGAAATRSQLADLIAYCRKTGKIVVFDAAYAAYIQDKDIPRSIYDVPGAEEVAIEVNSFSKVAGFTGVRLGWTVIPKAMRWTNGSVHADFSRIMSTVFNGASNIAQAGGLACLDPEGLAAIDEITKYYMTNATLLNTTFSKLGFEVTGGENAPYVWINGGEISGGDSWKLFADLLEHTNVVTTPGSGFGPAGQGFVRASAFGSHTDVEEACRRFTEYFSGRS